MASSAEQERERVLGGRRSGTLVGRMEALKSANLEGDLGEDGAESACSSGIRFLADTGADAGCGGCVTGATAAGSGVGFVRHRSAGVDGLLPLAFPPMPEKKASLPGVRGVAGAASRAGGRRLTLPPPSPSSLRTDVHSALRHPVPILPLQQQTAAGGRWLVQSRLRLRERKNGAGSSYLYLRPLPARPTTMNPAHGTTGTALARLLGSALCVAVRWFGRMFIIGRGRRVRSLG
jgi:hypothetical protein